jgi:uncharacterized protein YjbJ (UPF0337 family)
LSDCAQSISQIVAVPDQVVVKCRVSTLASGLFFSHYLYKEFEMGSEDVAAGKVKQAKGKANDIAGAVKGDAAQQIKGKAQQAVGKAQEKLGKS